jgi:transcriptional regulator with XRE-family HTH domain
VSASRGRAKTAKTRGVELLVETGLTNEELAARVKVSRALVSHWLRGARKPQTAHRRTLLRQLKIPVSAWDEAVAAKPTVDASPKALPPDLLSMTTLQLAEYLRRVAVRMIVDAENPQTPPGERARLARHAAETLVQVQRLTGEGQVISEAKILASPAWQRVAVVIEQSLTKYPEVMAELGEVLAKVGKEST